ncbi:MAG: hypothetical protein QNJ69_08365 [Gammaproteobacteria bacterium]|nr:hypothetical protein [Gammaproteobacteria bacterium]
MTAAILSYSALTAHANKPAEVICYVDGTDDLFKVYPRQLVFESDRFAIYQLIDGLTLLVINKQTRRFNRLSNLNLLPESTLDPEMPPEPYQYFTGQCQ